MAQGRAQDPVQNLRGHLWASASADGKEVLSSHGAAEPFLVLPGKPVLTMKLTERKAKQTGWTDDFQQHNLSTPCPSCFQTFLL